MSKAANKSNYIETHMVEMLDPEENLCLINESNRPVEESFTKEVSLNYPTYSFEEVAALLANNYHPAMFRKRDVSR